MTGWNYLNSPWLSSMLASLFAGVIILLLLIFAVVSFRCFIAHTDSQPPLESPLDILKKRYARGEISAEEYEHMKHFLES